MDTSASTKTRGDQLPMELNTSPNNPLYFDLPTLITFDPWHLHVPPRSGGKAYHQSAQIPLTANPSILLDDEIVRPTRLDAKTSMSPHTPARLLWFFVRGPRGAHGFPLVIEQKVSWTSVVAAQDRQ
jgi:hypothetical protein